jgi:C-terminal processing protease CtpA/Prc
MGDSDYYFVDKSEVTSKFSLMHTVNFRGMPLFVKTIFIAFSPLRIIAAGIICVKTRKKGNQYFYSWRESKKGHPNPMHFKGNIYVIINGGSFSATSLISSNLKGSGRAVFVGEETGGAYNGTVAGLMPTVVLPKSKLKLVYGLAFIQPHYKTNITGRGIFPDISILPTLEDRLGQKDLELNWILDDCKGLHSLKTN